MPVTVPRYDIWLLHPTTFQRMNMLGSNYRSLTWRKAWQGLGDCELQIGNTWQYLNRLLQPNTGIEIVRDGVQEAVYWVDDWEGVSNKDGDGWTVRGLGAPTGVTVRQTLPSPLTTNDVSTTVGGDFDAITGTVAEVLFHYLDGNCINSYESARNVSYLRLGSVLRPSKFPNTRAIALPQEEMSQTSTTDLVTFTWKARMMDLWGEMVRVAQAGNVGFRFRVDTDAGLVYFDILLEADRTLDSTAGWTPILFSQERNAVGEFHYHGGVRDLKTALYALGGGVSTTRVWYIALAPYVAEFLGAAVVDWRNPDPMGDAYVTPVSLATAGRREAMLDVREGASAVEVQPLVQGYFTEHGTAASATCVPRDTVGQQYLRHYDVGHKVSMVSERLGNIRGDATITEVKGELRPGQAPQITITCGTPKRDVLDDIIAIERGGRAVQVA